MTMATKLRINALRIGFFAWDPVKETKQEKTDAQGDHQTANQSFNKSHR